MLLENFRPQSKLVVRQTGLSRAKFPVIDAHNHLAEPFGGGWDQRPTSELLERLDEAGVIHYVDLDGGWGEDLLNRHLDQFKAVAPERFSIFGGIDWNQWQSLGNAFPEWAAKRLTTQKERGAQGLKIWKPMTSISITAPTKFPARAAGISMASICQTMSWKKFIIATRPNCLASTPNYPDFRCPCCTLKTIQPGE